MRLGSGRAGGVEITSRELGGLSQGERNRRGELSEPAAIKTDKPFRFS